MPLTSRKEEELRKEWEIHLKSIILYGETDSRIADWWLAKVSSALEEERDKIKSDLYKISAEDDCNLIMGSELEEYFNQK